jgi:prevent-host-death family protein
MVWQMSKSKSISMTEARKLFTTEKLRRFNRQRRDVTITRYGKPVAVMMSYDVYMELQKKILGHFESVTGLSIEHLR